MLPSQPPQLGADGSILEGVVTTLNADGSVNISPMGPIVDPQVNTLLLRPFQTSTTFQNLQRSGQGVFHVTDDVMLIAQAAVGTPQPLPQLSPAEQVAGMVLADACRWYEFEVESLDAQQQRTSIIARTVARRRNRDFFGFNRARHAVLEAAILATRIHLLPAEEIQTELDRLESAVQKTAGKEELAAFEFLRSFVSHQILQTSAPHA